MSVELDALNRLNLGTSKEVLKNNASSPLVDVLQLILQDVSDRLRESIDKHNISASNDLKQSIKVTGVQDNGTALSIGISANFYWKYMNYGVNGTQKNWGAPAWGTAPKTDKTFYQSISEWIVNRGIQLPESFTNYNSFAWAVLKNKIKFGQEPKPFVNDVINAQLVDEIREPIEAIFKRSLEIQITIGWQ
jgi:hypothetical protein